LASVQGHEVQYTTTLSGLNEFPPNASPGVGTALVTVDLDLATLRIQTEFSGLMGNVTAAHIHCCVSPDAATPTVGVATPTPTFPGFPSGVTSGSYDMTFSLGQASSYNAAFVTNNGGTVSGAMQALLNGLDSGEAYLNIHTSVVGAGEIRGFFSPIPEPGSASLLGLTLLGAPLLRRRRAAR
jgi:hypothetical protein